MQTLTLHPLLVLVVSFISLAAAAWLGALIFRRRHLPDAEERDFSLIISATLTLLGLIIGFSFSMAVARYDQRKAYEEAEANAIGTAFVRADLLPAADAAKVRALLMDYVGQRILYYTVSDMDMLRQVDVKTAKLQAGLWSAVLAPSLAQPNAVNALAVSGINDVLNSQGYTQAAWWNRIPVAAWGLMIIIAIFSNVLV